jgi:catechol 2,3-dioxygenase-like lactoylglutathione lyase family enzyme
MRINDIDLAVDAVEAPRLEASLREIVLSSPDVAGLSAFYSETLGYAGAQTGEEWRGRLAGRGLAIRPGPANTLRQAVFAVAGDAQLVGLRERLAAAGTLVEDVAWPGLSGSSVQVADPDGNRLTFGVAEPGPSDDTLAPRLQHVVFASDQVLPMLAFYRDVMGFAPADFVFDEAQDLTSVFLRCGEEHHSLAVFRASRRRLDHFSYEVEDWGQIRDWADRFAARRIPLKWGPGRHGPGNNLFLFVNDPDGNWLEFSAELERIVTPRPAGRWVHEERTLNSWGTAFLRS